VRVAGYVRVSTGEQAASGGGLGAQRDAITTELARRGWNLVEMFADEGISGKTISARPGLTSALEILDRGDADAILVSKLDRLSRSLSDFAGLIDRARLHGWSIVALDLGVDTTTPAGELVANVMASVAHWERRAIGERTKDALAVKRAQGVRLGRPVSIPVDVEVRIRQRRSDGLTLRAIARELNAEGVPTSRGGREWASETVRKCLARS
jgi:DNA invertase Pin-like site-specific DNA recombinase